MLIDHVDPKRDILDTIKIEVDGTEMFLKRGGSHGYWRVNYPKGRLPKFLEGQYTNKSLAEQAVRTYLRNLRKPVKDK